MCRRCATSSATSRRSKPSCSRLAAPYVAAMSHVAAPPLAMLHVAAPPLAMLHVACNVSRCMRCRRRAEWRGVEWRGGVLQSLCSIAGYAGCSEKVRDPDPPRTDELRRLLCTGASRLRACVRGLVALEHRNESASLGPGQMWRRQSALAECPNGSGGPGFPARVCRRGPPSSVCRPRRGSLFVCLFVCLVVGWLVGLFVRRKSFRRNSNSNPPTK